LLRAKWKADMLTMRSARTTSTTETKQRTELAAYLERLESVRASAITTEYRRGERICGPDNGHAAQRWHLLVAGMAHESIVLSDGRRRIMNFLMPGDFFGFTPPIEPTLHVQAIVEQTTVVSYPSECIANIADRDMHVARLVRQMAFQAIARLQARVLILGRMTALEKVSAFLLHMAERLPDSSSGTFALQMSRYDIADYLALSVETVSRAFTDLQNSGAIALSGKHRVRIVRRRVLECSCGGT